MIEKFKGFLQKYILLFFSLCWFYLYWKFIQKTAILHNTSISAITVQSGLRSLRIFVVVRLWNQHCWRTGGLVIFAVEVLTTWSLNRLQDIRVFIYCSMYDKIIWGTEGHYILVKSKENEDAQGPAQASEKSTFVSDSLKVLP